MKFRLLNIPVKIQPTFWIFLVFFTGVYRDPCIEGLIWGAVMFISLLVHEYGHALTALYFGAQPAITLEAFGGSARYYGGGFSPKQQFLITLNGPLFESFLILISYAVLRLGIFQGHYYIEYFFYVTMHLNIIWCLLNLIPLEPLDGGYLARYLLVKRFGPKGHKASILLGLLCAVAAAPYLWSVGYYFFAALLALFAIQALIGLGAQREESVSRGRSPYSSFADGVEAVNQGEWDKAESFFKEALKSKDPQLKASAIESLANIYLQSEEPGKAYKLLLQADDRLLKEGKSLLCRLAYERKNYELVCKYSDDLYDLDPSFEAALLNSKAHAGMGKPYLAGAWLFTASQFSACRERARAAMTDAIYDLVKEEDEFKKQVDQFMGCLEERDQETLEPCDTSGSLECGGGALPESS